MADKGSLLEVAEVVAEAMLQQGIPCIVIGAVALAAHRHVRFTEDIDLAVNASLPALRRIAADLKERGFRILLREPDAQDPLGGVIDVVSTFGIVQIISFADRFPAVIEDAIRTAGLTTRPKSVLRIAPVPHLVALKLYAGGIKSKADILELLQRNPGVDLGEIQDFCARYRLQGLDDILHELRD